MFNYTANATNQLITNWDAMHCNKHKKKFNSIQTEMKKRTKEEVDSMFFLWIPFYFLPPSIINSILCIILIQINLHIML